MEGCGTGSLRPYIYGNPDNGVIAWAIAIDNTKNMEGCGTGSLRTYFYGNPDNGVIA